MRAKSLPRPEGTSPSTPSASRRRRRRPTTASRRRRPRPRRRPRAAPRGPGRAQATAPVLYVTSTLAPASRSSRATGAGGGRRRDPPPDSGLTRSRKTGGSRDRGRPGLRTPGGVDAALTARSIATPTGPISRGQPRLVVAADGVVVGDRRAGRDHRVGGRGLGRRPLGERVVDGRAGLLGGDGEVERGAGLVDVRDVAEHQGRVVGERGGEGGRRRRRRASAGSTRTSRSPASRRARRRRAASRAGRARGSGRPPRRWPASSPSRSPPSCSAAP